ncbi:MAG: bifunctional folylpolyglutamate synthase/dihydrofolate synthase [Actinobacteria bacterium]|nr:bifunctional folylpolyglutamate synthase/dihydrofolate synthase [Actinomycetota bacterium]
MSWERANSHFEALGVDVMKSKTPSLYRIEALLNALDNPQRQVPAVHISGTNGKTSTARITASILSATGLSVGSYTSPHLERICERIALNGEPISEEIFGETFEHLSPFIELVESRLDEKLTYFELLTAMFFLWAAETPVDAAVVEVGLGGRWDATNVVNAPVSVVTNVGLDHTGLLGADPVVIAKEKAGIIKPGGAAVTGERMPDVLSVLDETALGAAVPLLALARDFHLVDNNIALGGRYLSIQTAGGAVGPDGTREKGGDYSDLYLPLHGRHQGANATVALQAATLFLPAQNLSPDVVAEGFAATPGAGRMEVIKKAEAEASIVMDVAHNPAGMSVLISSLAETFPFERVCFVLGVLADKDLDGMVLEMARLKGSIVATQAHSARSIPPQEIKAAAESSGLDCMVIPDLASALAYARGATPMDDLICVTGSHYVVGEARGLLIRGQH